MQAAVDVHTVARIWQVREFPVHVCATVCALTVAADRDNLTHAPRLQVLRDGRFIDQVRSFRTWVEG